MDNKDSSKIIRRKTLAMGGSALIATIAGCTGEHENLVNNNTIIESPPVNFLPQSSQLSDGWRVVWEDPRSSNSYKRVIHHEEVDVDETVVFVSVSINAFDTVEEAKEEYNRTEDRHNPGFGFFESTFGDESFISSGADDTHLYFRENNIFVNMTEMQGFYDEVEGYLEELAAVTAENIAAEANGD